METKNIFIPKTPYFYNIGDVINNMEIIEQTCATRNNGHHFKAYNVKCLKCKGVSPKTEYQLKNGSGCGICTNRIVVRGINDIATTHPYLIKYFKNKEDAYTITYSSSKKIDTICPYCGKTEKKMYIYNLDREGYSCSLCGIKISYPEKFIANFLDQLRLNFIPQLSKTTFDWCAQYKYDFYIQEYNMIIETHGLQHYEESNLFRMTLKDQQEIDNLKMKLALDNGIKYYIILDCRHSNLKWIKKSIMNSDLKVILNNNFDNIDWNSINLNAFSSDMIRACDLWNNNQDLTTKDIGRILRHTSGTISIYLSKGAEIGLCDYTGKKGNERAHKSSENYNSKKVFFDNTVYDSLTEFSTAIGKNLGQ